MSGVESRCHAQAPHVGGAAANEAHATNIILFLMKFHLK